MHARKSGITLLKKQLSAVDESLKTEASPPAPSPVVEIKRDLFMMIRQSSQPISENDDGNDDDDDDKDGPTSNQNKDSSEGENRHSIRARIRKSLSRPISGTLSANSPSPVRPKETPEMAKRKLGLI